MTSKCHHTIPPFFSSTPYQQPILISTILSSHVLNTQCLFRLLPLLHILCILLWLPSHLRSFDPPNLQDCKSRWNVKISVGIAILRKPIMRGNSAETLLPGRGEKGDDFGGSMVAKDGSEHKERWNFIYLFLNSFPESSPSALGFTRCAIALTDSLVWYGSRVSSASLLLWVVSSLVWSWHRLISSRYLLVDSQRNLLQVLLLLLVRLPSGLHFIAQLSTFSLFMLYSL